MTPTSALDQRAAWIALAAVEGLGEHLVPRIAEAFGGAAEVLEAATRQDAARFGHRLRVAAGSGLRQTTVDAVRATARIPMRSGVASRPWAHGRSPPGMPPIPGRCG